MRELPCEFRNADPFPHVVIDDCAWMKLASEAAAQVPDPSDHRWKRYPDKMGNGPDKLGITDTPALGGAIAELSRAMNSQAFVSWLSDVSGIPDLLSDPDSKGAGLHSSGRGGKLGVHVDFSKHKRGMYRRLNAFVYLNADWQPGWGGDLELWRDKPWEPAKRIAPLLGRLVIFECSSVSWHGHPEPLQCPKDRRRVSLAAYYFTRAKPANYDHDHSTIYRHA